MTVLLDANVLIALSFPEHLHNSAARLWLSESSEPFATCPITQGSLIRFVLRQTSNAGTGHATLERITQLSRHVFWPDSIAYGDVRLDGILGHSQITDAYLAELARVNGGRLATFDRGLAAAHPDAVDLIAPV